MINGSNEHHLIFKNGDTNKDYGAISPDDRGVGHIITAIDLPETYELMEDGNIKITFPYANDATAWLEDWTVFNLSLIHI